MAPKSFEEIRALFGYYTAVDDPRQRLIHKLVLETAHIKAPMAEIGVYRGGTSFLIANTDPERLLYACDTFEGLPPPTPGVDTHKHLDFNDTSYQLVKAALEMPNVAVLKGLFPQDTGLWLSDRQFSFVHLDVDLYQSTLDSLNFFYPRLVPGAVLLSDDYLMPTCPGVRKAFDEFMAGKPETLIDSGFKSCYFIKL